MGVLVGGGAEPPEGRKNFKKSVELAHVKHEKVITSEIS